MLRLSRIVAALVVALIWMLPGAASAEEWELLGRQKASPGIDRDVIKLNRNDGPYSAIKLRVNDNTVTLFSVKVVFGDGSEQSLPVGQLKIRPGEETAPLDLAGNRRNILRVELLYGGNLTALIRRPEIEVYALKVVERELPPLGRDWQLLGEGTVDSARDRDVIRVGRQEGRFSALILRVRGGDVNLRELRVIYDDGEGDLYRVRAELPADSETEAIDLRGSERAIRQVELVYDTSRRGRGRAKVEVWGREAAERELPPLPKEWSLLGQQRVDMARDRDVIRVGRDDGRYNAIVVRAKGGSVNLRQLRIVYGNGETEDLSFNRPLRGGEETRPIDLRGRFRFIDRIELTYDRERGVLRGPLVEVWARQAPEPELPPLGRDWRLAGQSSVDPGADSAVIEFGPEAGRLDALVLRARRNDVRLRGATVVYGNGEEEQLALDGPIYAGEETEVVDLKGRPRFIDRIELRLRPAGRGGRPAALEAWGRQVPEPVPPPLAKEWQLVGKLELDPGRDRASIDTGLPSGRADAVLIRVRRDDVRVRGLSIVYGDGEAEEVDVQDTLYAGEDGQVFEIKGRPRVIERVELRYRAGSRGSRRPEIEVWARQAKEPELPPLPREWQLLGKQTVDLGRERQIVDVSGEGGRMNALVLRVRRDDIRLRRLRLVYGDGEEEEIPLDTILYAGEETSVIDLKGRARFIQSIEIVTRALGRTGRRAELEIWGRPAPEPVPPPLSKEWQVIGKQSLDPSGDSESIEIGAEDWRYNGLIVRVRRSDLKLTGLSVVYGNGERDEVDIDETVFAGEDSPVIELKGRPRFIDRIEIAYRSGSRRARPSEVEIWGRAAREPEPPPLDRAWVLLGKDRVDLGRDRGVFEVKGESRVNGLVLRVRGNDIDLRRIKLIYQGGDVEELDVGQRIYAGDQTTPIDLKGRARFLQSVELAYRAVDRARRPAEVELWGRIAKDEPFGSGWRRVDALPVDRRQDKVVYELNRRDGRVRAVGIRAGGGTIRLTGIAMLYGNGDKDARPLDDRLRPDATTRPIDVTGNRRAFERIEVYYERTSSIDSRTQLELWVRD